MTAVFPNPHCHCEETKPTKQSPAALARAFAGVTAVIFLLCGSGITPIWNALVF
jgi:hypothetical protein